MIESTGHDPRKGFDRSSKTQFDVFISYSHAADGALAPALQSTLQSLAKPLWRRRALRVFRDQTTLALAPELWPEIERALDQSRYFLLLASAESCRSEWVQREVRHWLTRPGGAQTLLIVLTGGQLEWSTAAKDFDWSRTNAVPPILSGVFRGEPFYLDLRWATGVSTLATNARFRDAVATIASTVRGVPKDDLIGEDLRRHKQMLVGMGAVAVLTTALAAGAAWQAMVANRQRQLAVSKQLVASGQLLRADAAGWPERAALLAIESLRLAPTSEATLLLRRAAPLLARVSTTLRHPGGLRGMAASPDVGTIATVGQEGKVVLWDRASEKQRATLDHNGEAQGVLFNERGNRILTVGGVEARLWNTRTATHDFTLAHSTAVLAAAINDTGDRIATASVDGTVTLWDGNTGALISRTRRGELVTAMEFAGQNRNRLVVIAHDGRLQMLGSEDGGLLASLELGCERPDQLAIAPSKPEIAAILCDDGAVKMWDLSRQTMQDEWSVAPEKSFASPFDLDSPHSRIGIDGFGGVVAAGFRTGTVRLRIGTADLPRLEHRDVVNSIAFSSDLKFLATASRDGTARLWDASRGQEIVRWTADPPTSRAAASLYVRFGDDSQWLVSGFADGTVKIIEPAKQVSEGVLFRADDRASPTMGVVRATGQVVIADWRTLRFVDQTNPGKSREIKVKDPIDSIVLSNDGRRVGVTTEYGMLVVDAASGAVLFEESQHQIASMALNADGTRLVVAENAGGTVKVWDVDQGEVVSEVAGVDRTVVINAVAFLPGDQQVVIGSGDPQDTDRDAARGGAVSWDLKGEQVVRRFSDAVAPTKVATALAVSPDGSIVAIVDGLNRLDLWDLRTAKRLGRATTRNGIASLAFSRDGRSIAAGSVDSVHVWALDRLVETAVIETPAQADKIGFTGDDSRLAVLSAAVIEVHSLKTSDLISFACQRLERNFNPAEWVAALGEGEAYRETCPDLPSSMTITSGGEPGSATTTRDGLVAKTGDSGDESRNQKTGESRASATMGSIAGQVTDATGAVIPGVWVAITGPAIKGKREAIVSGKGRYEFSKVPFGEYSIKFELPGFETVVRNGIRVRSGDTVGVDVTMRFSKSERTK